MGPAWAQRPLMGVLWLLVLWVLLSLVCCSQTPPTWHFTSSEVVIPRKAPQRRGGIKIPNQLAYIIRFRGQRHVIHMKLKTNLMPRDFPVITNNDQEAMQEDYPYVPRDCYYYSYLEGIPGSMATLDTCYGGLRGMLQVDDFIYEIKPLEASSKFEHVISMLVSDEHERCKIEEEQQDKIVKEVNLAESPRAVPVYLWQLHMKHFKIHYTLDKTIYKMKKNISLLTDNVMVINSIMDSIYRAVNLYVYIRLLCIWTSRDSFDINTHKTKDIGKLLELFGYWKEHRIHVQIPHDISVLYTSYVIKGKKYASNYKSYCNPNWGAAYVHLKDHHLFIAAAITVHTLGHGLALNHDDPSCFCFRRSRCVMNEVPGLLDMFSNCSLNVLHGIVHGWDNCMTIRNIPYQQYSRVPNRCGDKIITEKEQCDCGSLKDCANDSCCETTCVFSSGSTCDEGGCCIKCKFAKSGRLCRDIRGICDLPEYCDGTKEQCPNDFYVQDGTPCSPVSVCASGNCSDRDMQCQALFGLGVKDGSPLCYEKLNVIGDRFGNCGLYTRRGGTYPKKCEADDILCGMLHCSNVHQIPGIDEHSTMHHIMVGESKLESCFGLDTHYGQDLPEAGLVVDGATCGPGLYCFKKNCTFYPDINFNCDVKKCNFRGVCNNKENCHCLKGYKPPDCNEKGLGGSEDSGPPSDIELDVKVKIHLTVNKGLLVILSRVTAFILVILIGVASKSKQVQDEKKTKAKK